MCVWLLIYIFCLNNRLKRNFSIGSADTLLNFMIWAISLINLTFKNFLRCNLGTEYTSNRINITYSDIRLWLNWLIRLCEQLCLFKCDINTIFLFNICLLSCRKFITLYNWWSNFSLIQFNSLIIILEYICWFSVKSSLLNRWFFLNFNTLRQQIQILFHFYWLIRF